MSWGECPQAVAEDVAHAVGHAPSEVSDAQLRAVAVAQQLAGEERVAGGPVPERVDEDVLLVAGQPGSGGVHEVAQPLLVEGAEREPGGQLADPAPAQEIRQRRMAAARRVAEAQHHEGPPRQSGRQVGQHLRGRVVEPLAVLDHQQQRCLQRDRVEEPGDSA